MAGDWIKMRVDLDTDPSVIVIADTHQLNPLDVIGRLWKVWAWADQHLRDGHAKGVTSAFLDRIAAQDGFARSMESVGWLRILSTGLSFPDFERHNGKPAKERALTRDRVKRHRAASSVTPPLPEKRREEVLSTQAASSVGKGAAPPEPAAAQGLPPPTPPDPITAQIITAGKALMVDVDEATAKAWAKVATIGQVSKALQLARSHGRKPQPEPCPASYVSPILREIVTEDRKARAAADAKHQATKALIAEQQAAAQHTAAMPEKLKPKRRKAAPDPEPEPEKLPEPAAAVESPRAPAREAEPPEPDAVDPSSLAAWWLDPEQVMARAVELQVPMFEGENFDDFTARVLAQLGPGDHLEQIEDQALLSRITYFTRIGPTSDAARPPAG